MCETPGRVAVVGVGSIGRGVVHIFAQAGFEVFAASRDGSDRMTGYLNREVDRGRLGAREWEVLVGRVTSCAVDDLPQVDLVIESIVEAESAKRDLFTRLERSQRVDTILASSTSTIPIALIASDLDHPERVIGMHYMTPVPIMRLVEVVRSERTSDETWLRAVDYCVKTGKEAVTVRDVPGFVASRLAQAMINEAAYILDDGVADAESIDLIARLGLNLPIGPLRLLDEVGAEVALRGLESLRQRLDSPRYEPSPVILQKVRDGDLGRKTGAGIYTYTCARGNR
ncbi:MAG: 3-hydroxyacyl-CoA dehydrogenase family protein [Micromonosporaceae bacterium]|nr:3-hydroxyacyl-CoA dehydrogenase family protein [Micromonosporaceae bacterium]